MLLTPPPFFGLAGAKLLDTVVLPTDNAFSPVNDGGGQAGELMVVYAAATGVGSLAKNIPSGWIDFLDSLTSLNTTSGLTILFRKLNGSETGDVSFFSNPAAMAGRVQRFRWTGTPVAADTAAEQTNGNPSAQTINADGQTAPILAIAMASAVGGAIDPFSFSPSEGYDSGDLNDGSTNFRIKHLLYPEGSTPADITVDTTDEGSNNALASGYLVNS